MVCKYYFRFIGFDVSLNNYVIEYYGKLRFQDHKEFDLSPDPKVSTRTGHIIKLFAKSEIAIYSRAL